MLKITKKIEYALMALRHMRERPKGELTTAREICDKYGAPFDTTAKVLQLLNAKGVVRSIQGVKGGYELDKPLNTISYRDLEVIIEGRTSALSCLSERSKCELIESCNIISPVQRLEFKLNEFLEKLSIEEVLFNQSDLAPPLIEVNSQ
jgi:Rrf2 family protein